MPKEFSLTLNYEAKTELTVPYGYAVTLKEHADTEKSYDYTVNGKLYHQGDVYTVTGDTLITRREGKAVAKYNMATVIAASLTPGAQLSEQEKAVLTAGGLKDSSVWYRVPDQAAALVNISALEEAGSYRIMAAEYDSGLLSGAKWTAANAQIIDATGAVIDTVTLENGIGTFTCEEFDHVKVNYTLTVSDRLSKPNAWDLASLDYYFGEYGEKKHELMMKWTEKSWDDEYINSLFADIYGFGTLSPKDPNYIKWLAGWFAEQLEQENVERLQNKLDVWKESDTGKPVDFTPKEWGR